MGGENLLTEPCGSRPCNEIVDRWGMIMKDQQAQGFESIKELMTVHHENLRSEIKDLKQAQQRQGDEIFPRLRRVEGRLDVIEATGTTEDKVKKLVAENETVTWTARRRSFERAVAKVLAAAIILAILGTGISMYSSYVNSKPTVKETK